MSNLYKGRYTVTNQSQYCVINSNQILAEKLQKLAQHAENQGGFVEGMFAPQIELLPEEPEISLEEKRAEAEKILQDAREQAAQLIAEAEGRVETIQKEAKAVGERQGYELGQQHAARELEAQEQQLEVRKQQLEEEYRQLRDDLEPQLVNVLCDVFEKVFHIQFNENKEILLHLLKNAILKIESSKEFHVRVSEKNYQYLEAHKNEVLSQVGQNIRIDMEADAAMDETQCVIDTDSGFFECGIDVQLQNLIKAIRTLSV